jgi:hypothetical protein
MPPFIRLLKTPADELMLSRVESLALEAALDLKKALDSSPVPEVPIIHGLVRVEGLDLDEYPPVSRYKAHPDIQFTLGDLHGNALKLIHFLVFHGVMTTTREEYKTLVRIYNKPAASLTAENLREFCAILNAATFNEVAMLRFIGDIFCDRGNNDYLTLKILERLDEAKVRLEIIMSNHDFGLFYWRRTGKLVVKPHDSLAGLITLLEKGLIHLEEVDSLLEKHYKPYLKLISYSLARDSERASLYTHTRIGLDSIKKIAGKMGVELREDTIDIFFASLDNINAIFQRYLKEGKVWSLFIPSMPSLPSSSSDPFYMLVWNKNLSMVPRLPSVAGVLLEGVHGHEPDMASLTTLADSGFVGLDYWLGKELYSHSLAKYCKGCAFTPAQIESYRALHQHVILCSNDFHSHQLQEARELRDEAAEYQHAREAISKAKCVTRSGSLIMDAAISDRDEWVVAEKPRSSGSIHFFRIVRSATETTAGPTLGLTDGEDMGYLKPRSMLA